MSRLAQLNTTTKRFVGALQFFQGWVKITHSYIKGGRWMAYPKNDHFPTIHPSKWEPFLGGGHVTTHPASRNDPVKINS